MGNRRALSCAFYAYCLVVVLFATWSIVAPWETRTGAQRVFSSRAMSAGDSDLAQWLLPGLTRVKTLSQTLAWWHGAWVGQVPFWRPLTSYAFWAEYRIFTPDRYDRWAWVSAASNLIFTAALFVFVWRLTQRPRAAALSALIFTATSSVFPVLWAAERLNDWGLPLLGFANTPPAMIAMDFWKNQPEAWAGTLTLAAMTLALSRRWTWCLICVGLAIGIKESGWLAFPLIGLTLWATDRRQGVPRSVLYAGAGLALVLVLLRAASGWDVFYGYHYGSNANWWRRYALVALGPCFSMFVLPTCLFPALFGTLLFALIRLPGLHHLVRLGLACCMALAVAGAMAVKLSVGLDVTLAMLLMWRTGLQAVVLALLWLLGAAMLWAEEPRRYVLALALMGLIAALPIAAASQVQEHVLYLSYAFDSILVGLTLVALGKRLAALLRPVFCWVTNRGKGRDDREWRVE